ncbi:Protein of unknown function [Bacillus mobilis]|nr:Protein of unknown function [Bacillus mobilis]
MNAQHSFLHHSKKLLTPKTKEYDANATYPLETLEIQILNFLIGLLVKKPSHYEMNPKS